MRYSFNFIHWKLLLLYSFSELDKMAIKQKVAVQSNRSPSMALHFTRQELKEYLDRFEITAVEKISKVFGGLPCRTVKVFPLPDDYAPETIGELFSDVSGHVVATLSFTENHVRAMFVSFTFEESVQFAIQKNGQSTGSSSSKFDVNVKVLPDIEYLKFLQAIVIESRFLLHGEKKRRFEHPDPRGTTLSEELDIYLSVLRSTLHREKRKADDEEDAKLAASEVGLEEPSKQENNCHEHKKSNKFEIAYANKKVKEFDQADQPPNSFLPPRNGIQRLKEKKRPARFSYLTLGALVVTAVVGCYIFQRMNVRVGVVGVIAETSAVVL